MGIANKLNSNRKQTVREGIDTKQLTYIKADELGKTNPPYPLPLAGFFIKDGEYGKQITLIVDDGNEIYGVNVPKRYAEQFEGLEDNDIDDILEGHVGIQSIQGNVKTPRGITTMIVFTDM